MKKVLQIIEWTLFVALLAIIFVSISSFLPTKNILSSYVVASGSMEPTLMTGALVFTKYIEPAQLKVGDIITFTQPTNPKNMIVHRVERVIQGKGLLFRTKGDNNKAADNWTVTSNEIKGKMLYSVPYVGYAVSWLKTPLGFLIAIGIPALLLIILQILKIKQGITQEVEKRVKKHLANHSVDTAVISTILVLALFSLPLSKTYAYFTTHATINGINLIISSIGPTPTITPTVTPSVTPSVTPTPTITPSISPTPTGDCSNVVISGTGAGSVNTIECTNTNSTVITQSNTTSTSSTTSVTTNTGGNTITGNTGSSGTTQLGSTVTIVETTTTNGSNTSEL